MKKSLAVLSGILCLSSVAEAAAPISLRHGEARRLVLNEGRSVLVSCTRLGGRQTAAEIPLAAGRSIQLMLYRERAATLISCADLVPQPLPPIPPNPIPMPPSRASTEVAIFSNSDSCQGNLADYAILRAGEDPLEQCRAQLRNPNASAWSIRTNGRCKNIQDTNALSACAQTLLPQLGNETQVTVFSGSDSCSGPVSASGMLRGAGTQTEQCQALAARGNGRGAWSIRVGAVCQNIQDTDVLSACMNIALPNAHPNAVTDLVIYSGSDSCMGSVAAAGPLYRDEDPLEQCKSLKRLNGLNSAWSIRVEGVCQNIQDTNIVSACLNVRLPSSRLGRQVILFSGSDSCSGAVTAAGYIDPRFSTIAQCQALKQNGNRNGVWSARVDDRCINIQDTDIVSACIGLNL